MVVNCRRSDTKGVLRNRTVIDILHITGFVQTKKPQQIENVDTTGEKQVHDEGGEKAPNLPQDHGQSTHHTIAHRSYNSTDDAITNDMKYIRFYTSVQDCNSDGTRNTPFLVDSLIVR